VRPVAHALGRESYRLLAARGYDVEWRSYWCGHVVAPRAIRDLRAWLHAGGPAAAALEPRERVPQGGLAAA
jgi:predicted esterase